MTRLGQSESRDAIDPCVEELQGADGAFSFSEIILQKIWLKRDFDQGSLFTTSGLRLEIIQPGRWNRTAGPDFRGARFRLDGRELAGDVEMHVKASDWDAHRHAQDPEYDHVVLHVVLFPPSSGQRTMGVGGREIPSLCLLPLLPRDLESYALDDAAEHLAGRPSVRLFESLSSQSPLAVARVIARHAADRWDEKCHFARHRVERYGWLTACHQTALECLGYSGNRAAMLKLADRWPLKSFMSESFSADEVWRSMGPIWRTRCGRPANHPLQRLRQYADWVKRVPDWPARLEAFCWPVEGVSEEGKTREVRQNMNMAALRTELSQAVVAFPGGGRRFDTLVCDMALPLAATLRSGLRPVWRHWYLGDCPDAILAAVRDAVRADCCLFQGSNGLAQGLIGWNAAQLGLASLAAWSAGGVSVV